MTEKIPVHSFDHALKNAGRSVRTAAVAGTGFFLAFGWVWFPSLFSSVAAWYPGAFSGTLLSGNGITAFSLALFFGLLACAGLARTAPPPGLRSVVLLHAGALCGSGAAALLNNTAPLVSSLLWGLSVAGPGVWWGGLIVRLPAPLSGAALAVATVLAWILAAFVTTPTGFVFPCAGIVVATALAVLVERREPDGGEAAIVNRDASVSPMTKSTPIPTPTPMPAPTPIPTLTPPAGDARLLFVLLGYSLFAFGLMTPAFAKLYPGDLSARALGIGIAIPVLSVFRQSPLKTGYVAASVSLAAALLLLVFPNDTWVNALFGGVAEAMAVAGIALLPGKFGTMWFSRAGFGLAAIFILTNIGGVVGARITLAGDLGLGLFAVIIAGLFVPLYMVIARRPGTQPARPEAAPTRLPGEGVAVRADAAESTAATWPTLTRRECTVADLLIRGMSNPEICAALFVSDNTVRTHIKNIYRKTGATSREELKMLFQRTSSKKHARHASSSVAAKESPER